MPEEFICNLLDPGSINENWGSFYHDQYRTAVNGAITGPPFTIIIGTGPNPPTCPNPDWIRIVGDDVFRQRLRIKRMVLEPDASLGAAQAVIRTQPGLPIHPVGFGPMPDGLEGPEQIKIGDSIYSKLSPGSPIGPFPDGDTVALPLEIDVNGVIYSRDPARL